MQNSFIRCAFGGPFIKQGVVPRFKKNASLKAERTMQKNTWGWDVAIFGSVRLRVSKNDTSYTSNQGGRETNQLKPKFDCSSLLLQFIFKNENLK